MDRGLKIIVGAGRNGRVWNEIEEDANNQDSVQIVGVDYAAKESSKEFILGISEQLGQ
jgi:hypothetical protein